MTSAIANSSVAGPSDTDSPRAESLEEQLLEGLDANSFDDQLPADRSAPGNVPPAEGEDLGPAPEAAALARVRDNMRTAESLIQSRDSSPRTREVQQRVIDDLDALIAQLDKQCQGACKKPGSEMAKKSGKSMGTGQTAAADSTDRLDRRGAKPVQLNDAQDFVKEYWGHLPEAERNRLLQGSQIEFLPKYERELEQYYRRLAEEESGNISPSKQAE